MAPAFRIHKPDVLATLPRPLDHSKGQYHAGEVFTQQPGSKKRKRLEVAVGVDGEAANIYHIPSSDLRTSYPIPPQESFTCAPYSIRYQRPNANERDQYTYFSTKDGSGSKMTVCKDVVSATGKTTSTTKSQRLPHKAPVTRIYTSYHANASVNAESEGNAYGDVLAVCDDGQVVCLDGAALDERWSMSAYSLCKDLLPPATSGLRVDSVFHGQAVDFLKGVFGGRQDAFGAFGRNVDAETFNPDVLALVVSTRGKEETGRYLIVLGAIARSGANTSQQAVVQLHVAPLPSHDGLASTKIPTYQLHVRTGRLIELCDSTMRTYDLKTAVPRLRDAVIMPDASSSFVQLSEHSVLSLSPAALTITNITYRSVQAQATVSMQSETEGGHPPMLLTYLSKLDLAIAVANNTIYSIQIERHKASSKEGLLIDAIGRGLSKADHLPSELPQRRGKSTFSRFLPGTLTDAYVKQSLVEVEEMDEALGQNDLKEFERLLAAKFGVAIDSATQPEDDDTTTPDWQWLERPSAYPPVDRRWVLYAISRVFSVDVKDVNNDCPALNCVLPESNALLYLVVAGHLTLSNILAAFRGELKEAEISLFALADVLVQQLVGVDPALELLMSYLSATKLGEVELLLIVRTIMQSLDQQPQLALPMPNGTQEEDYVAMEIDKLERELELAEYNLGDESNVRARLLTAAFERLAGYSSVSTVRALRIAFDPTEILALIHLLRIQLVGSAWTTRYTEMTTFDQDEAARTASDGVITLIAELLARCIDAVGTNGWLTNVSVGHQADGGHFLTALKLEVSAALEGLNEAVEMNGILGEAVRFGTASLTGPGRGPSRGGDRARALEVVASAELPLGLTPKQGVTQFKVVSGGEVVERSARERGHLLSQRVKEYSLEKISI